MLFSLCSMIIYLLGNISVIDDYIDFSSVLPFFFERFLSSYVLNFISLGVSSSFRNWLTLTGLCWSVDILRSCLIPGGGLLYYTSDAVCLKNDGAFLLICDLSVLLIHALLDVLLL